jgi:hypothetical protein
MAFKKTDRPAFTKPTETAPEQTVPAAKPRVSAAKPRVSAADGREFDNSNRGTLFENDKGDNVTRPDLTGKAYFVVPEGSKAGDLIERRIAAWEKQSKAGKNYLSLVFSEPQISA